MLNGPLISPWIYMAVTLQTIIQCISELRRLNFDNTVWCYSSVVNSWQNFHNSPDSKVQVAHMGPTWVLSAPGGPHVGTMNLAIWEAPYSSPVRARYGAYFESINSDLCFASATVVLYAISCYAKLCYNMTYNCNFIKYHFLSSYQC